MKLETPTSRARHAVAIIGVGCRFPSAHGPAAFWSLLRNGTEAIGEIPAQRWDVDALYDPAHGTPGKTNTRRGAFLDDIDRFDAAFFRVTPFEAEIIDPQHRLVLEVAWEALEHAGVVPGELAGTRTGVFIGVSHSDYERLIYRERERITGHHGSGTYRCIAANRLSYALDLRGPSLAVDTACSSSLVAVHLACQSLLAGESDVALAGGVNVILLPDETVALSLAGIMAPDGRCKTFDARADGYVRGEGCGILVLKRLCDARRDDDPVIGVILGSAVNHDGLTNGLTSPSGPAQQALIRAALDRSGVRPAEVTYVEAQGTGTSLGDSIEMKSIKAVLGDGRAANQPCWVGSVKTNIGHLEAASGVASLIKVVLALHHGEIPAHLNLAKLNPYLGLEGTPFSVPTELRPWPGPSPRVAGVTALGFGGANCHVLVAEAGPDPDRVAAVERPRHLLTLSARTPAALRRLASCYADHLDGRSDLTVGDVCFTANAGRTHFEHRLALVAESAGGVVRDLRAVAEDRAEARVMRGRASGRGRHEVAFVAGAEGIDHAVMGQQLFETQPRFREEVRRCGSAFAPYLGRPVAEVMFGVAPPAGDHPTMTSAHAALFTMQYALIQTWRSWGVEPDVMLGHGLGEYVTACVAGVFSLEDAARLVATRARLLGAMAQATVEVFTSEARVGEAIAEQPGDAWLAAINGTEHLVLTGVPDAVGAVVHRLRRDGIVSRPVKAPHTAYSPLVDAWLHGFKETAGTVRYAAPRLDIVSTVTGHPIGAEIATADHWVRHARTTVQFTAGLEALRQRGVRLLLAMTPTPELRMLTDEPIARWSWVRDGGDDWDALLEALGRLHVAGVAINWREVDRGYARRRVMLPTYPFERSRHWFGASERGHAPGVPPRGDATEHERSLREYIRGLISAMVGIAAEDVGVDRPLRTSGVLSPLMAMELKNRLRRDLGIDVPREAIKAEVTIASLAADLSRRLAETTGDPACAAAADVRSPDGVSAGGQPWT